MNSQYLNNRLKMAKGIAFLALISATGISSAQVLATIPNGEIPRGSVNTFELIEAAGVAPQNISLSSNVINLSTSVRLARLDTDSSQGGAYQHGFILNDVRFLFHPELNSAFRVQTVSSGYHSGNQAHGVTAGNKVTDFSVTLTPNGQNGVGDTYLDVSASFVVGANSNTITYLGNRGGTNDFTTGVIGDTISRFAIYKVDNIINSGGSQNNTVHTSDFQNTKLEVKPVPEPSSTLLSIAGLGLVAIRRKRK